MSDPSSSARVEQLLEQLNTDDATAAVILEAFRNAEKAAELRRCLKMAMDWIVELNPNAPKSAVWEAMQKALEKSR